MDCLREVSKSRISNIVLENNITANSEWFNVSKIQILGIGSAFGDDQAGWLAISLLQQKINLKRLPESAISLMKVYRPSLDILNTVQTAEYMFLVDAVVTRKAPIGTLWHFEQEEITNAKGLISTHGISVIDILAIGKNLYKLPGNIEYLGIEINPSNNFAEVSPQILRAIEQLTDKIITQVGVILSKVL